MEVENKCNLLRINTNGLCLLCFKECSLRTRRVNETSVKFFRVLSRYSGLNVSSASPHLLKDSHFLNKLQLDFSLCEDCSALANVVCKTFQEWELMQMNLNARIQTVCQIMKSAEKIPTRLAEFRKRAEVKVAKNIRGEIMSKCTQKNFSTQPKVLIRKLEQNGCIAVVGTIFKEKDMYMLSLLGCIISFWLVISLSVLDIEELAAKFRLSKKVANLLGLTVGGKQEPTPRKRFRELSPPPKSQPLRKSPRNKPPLIDPVKNSKELVPVIPARKQTHLDHLVNHMVLRKRPDKQVVLPPAPSPRLRTPKKKAPEDATPGLKRTLRSSTSSRKVSRSSIDNDYTEVCPVITPEKALDAVNAVNASRIRIKWEPADPQISGTQKTLKVSEEEEIQLLCHVPPSVSSGNTESSLVPYDPNAAVQVQNTSSSSYVLHFVKAEHSPPSAPQFYGSNTTSAISICHVCHICQLRFQSRALLQKHLVVYHQLPDFVQCPRCSEFFPSYYLLIAHRLRHKLCTIDERALEVEAEDIARPLFPYNSRNLGNKFCPYEDCCEVFLSDDDVQIHLRAHGSFHCSFCGIQFGKAHELASHELKYHSSFKISDYEPAKDRVQKNRFRCARCSYNSKREHGYISHFLQHHLNIPTNVKECAVCHKTFSASTGHSIIESHYETHHNLVGKDPNSILVCQHCSFYTPFLRRLQLQLHERTFHNIQAGVDAMNNVPDPNNSIPIIPVCKREIFDNGYNESA